MERIKNVVWNKKSKVVIALIVVVLAIYGGFMWNKKSAQAPETEAPFSVE